MPARSRPASGRCMLAALPFDVRAGDVEANLAAVLDGLERAAAAGARLLALPEMWTSSFLTAWPAALRRASDAALAAVHRRARALRMTVIGSAPGGAGPKPANELHLLGAAGDLRPYRKRVLFSPSGEGRQCRAGDGAPATVPTPAGRAAGVICYDLRFPELTRGPFRDGADLLVVPAQWPHPRTGVFELLARARAAENQCYVLACNRAGSARLGTRTVSFPGTALLLDPLGQEAGRSDGGALLLAPADYDAMAAVRRAVPCARDLKKAGLAP